MCEFLPSSGFSPPNDAHRAFPDSRIKQVQRFAGGGLAECVESECLPAQGPAGLQRDFRPEISRRNLLHKFTRPVKNVATIPGRAFLTGLAMPS
jgi:hypothetical protein